MTDGATVDAHRRTHRSHIEAGYCAAVNEVKAWCTQRAGHADGSHVTPQVGGPDVVWTETVPCPCDDR